MAGDKFNLKINHYGPYLKDKIIYNININDFNCGFFATHRKLLEYLYFADICGYIPVIQYGNSFLYAEDHKINGTSNPYEYYFRQPSIQVKDVKKCHNVILSDSMHSDMVSLILNGKYGVYDASLFYINQMARISRKYVKQNSIVDSYISNELGRLIGEEKILGVHVRGSDFKCNYHIHPVYVETGTYLEETRKQFDKGNWDRVFLATDDEDALEVFRKEFGSSLLYYGDVYRTGSNKSVAFSSSEREDHHYKLGLEVLRDVYTLASCGGLISGISQVSLCARIIHKDKTKKEYEYLNCIHNGINLKGRHFREHTRKQKNVSENLKDAVRHLLRSPGIR